MKLIIDADIPCFRSALKSETLHHWGTDMYVLVAHLDAAKHSADSRIEHLKEVSGADEVLLAFTGSQNWRKNYWKDYKSNRKETRKPIIYYQLKEYLQSEYDSIEVEGLEADDLLGIYATSGNEDVVIFSEDKDLKTIYGKYLHQDDVTGEWSVKERSVEDADNFHLIQTLAGDITDGYKGCPNVGMDKATEIVINPYVFEPYEHTFKSGKRKGQTEIRYNKKPVDDKWAAVVSQYEKQDLTEEDALLNARMANILRADQYDFDTGEIKLWGNITMT